MTAMRKIWATRVNNATAATYVGKKGTIFFDELTGALRISDGTTIGGQPLTLVASDFAFQFGDFIATTETDSPFGASLSSLNANQDINIVSNGTGNINIIGEFAVYKPDTDVPGAMAISPIFTVRSDGQVQMLVPGADSTEGAVNIVGGLDGVFQPPVNTGVMLHITGIAGTPGVPSRVYNDAQNAFAAFVARRYNGTAASPSAVLDGEEIMRISGTAHDGTTIPGAGNTRILYKAVGNQTLTNHGGAIELWTTPQNTTTLAKVASIDNVNGITSTKFTGPLFGNVIATTVTATNLIGALSPSSQLGITSVGTLTNLTVANTVTSAYLSGKIIHLVRDAGTIGAGGTVTIDFATDDVVLFVWGDGVNLAYSNYTAGRIVKVIARKATGTGVDTFNLDGLTAANVSSGATTFNGSADQTYFIELISTNTSIGGVYAKL